CRACPLAKSCLGKTAKEKKFSVTYYREEYERNIARLATSKGRAMKSKRQSTVEPVFGTLTQFMGMRKINTLGIQQANKVMHLSAMAYNLKKYLKFVTKSVKSKAKALALPFLNKKTLSKPIVLILS
uniref:transposase n=1 Tax=Polaribacter porphyrae TaxID=1137780 RepID=UPI001CFF6897